ncbi:metalloregulator ArsR/SmtB family transcription factor [Dactylosporangium fulvum]|uniref:Metalloregulator ArsR/SmtB family transcription factor n=1 Tax=Dactylosporangium fulvum TaxID=53359 RepID=A0ABY5VN21_9ACTN|nr:metalloregulator ArsR/SmtB family transcription factor [Dactylosporangium fulvum]UWP78459.1 metalloregulator ArsR/SmtB family transcription factor [Dactylosporangium fulvum]
MDEVFKALADDSRRELLDRLNSRNGQTLRELCEGLGMARQSVSKHLAVLEAAGLVTTTWRGREKLHYLDAAPINAIAERWIDRYHRGHARALADLKRALEDPMGNPVFAYTTYIATTPERLWQALTDPEFTRQYWGGVALHSDWRPDSPVLWQDAPGEEFKDYGDRVLRAEPPRLLSYTWHTFRPEHAQHFGWSDEELAERAREPRSKVTFTIEPAGPQTVKLTLIHDDFVPGSVMHEAISGRLEGSGGWPELLAGLKTLLETGVPLPA